MYIAILDWERVRAGRMCRSLGMAGYICQAYHSPERFLDALDGRLFDILLLGVDRGRKGVPAMIGQVKEKGLRKILILAETGQIAAVDEALAAGADDYLCFPLRQHELQMRVSVLARQIVPDAQSRLYLQYGDFAFWRYPNSVMFKDKRLELTAREFDLALLFFRHVNMPLSRAHIAEAVWKMDGNDMARTIDTHVSRVRNKLNLKPGNGFLLEQVYGFGYRLQSLAEK